MEAPLTEDVEVSSIATFGDDDVWVAGTEFRLYPTPSQPLLLHWDGKAWTRPALPLRETGLTAIGGAGPRDVWVTGWRSSDGRLDSAHWDGRSWRAVPIPNDRRSRNNLSEGIVALPSGEAWVVGVVGPGEAEAPLAERWDGSRWRPAAPPRGSLLAVSATTARDVWTVGFAHTGEPVAVAYRWNGARWRAVAVPRPRYSTSSFSGVVVQGPRAWLFGHTETAHDRDEEGKVATYSFYWDGARWHPVPLRDVRRVGPARRGGAWAARDVELLRVRGATVTRAARVPWAGREGASIAAVAESRTGTLWVAGHYSGSADVSTIATARCRLS